MSDPSTKAELINAMVSAREKYDSLLKRIPLTMMTLVPVPGEWSVKDIVAHVNSYDRWLALGLALRGQRPPDLWVEDIPLDDFNRRLYQDNRELLLDDVLRESRDLWQHILGETQARPEVYLFAVQTVEGVPYTFRPCDLLKSESYGHYLDHVPALRSCLEAGPRA